MSVTSLAGQHPLGVKRPAQGTLHADNELRYAMTALMTALLPPRRPDRIRPSYSTCRCRGVDCICVVDAPTRDVISCPAQQPATPVE